MNETQEIEKRYAEKDEIIVRAKDFLVVDQASLDGATERIKLIKGLAKEVDETFGPMKKKTHDAHKEVTTKYNGFIDPLKEAEKTYKASIGAYMQEEERKAREEARKAEEEAQAKRAKEIEKSQRAFEKQLAQANGIEGKIALCEKQLEGELSDEERQSTERELRKLQRSLETSQAKAETKAEAVVAATEVAPIAAPVKATPKMSGANYRTTKTGRVTNPMLIIKAVANGEYPLELLTVDQSQLNKLVSAGMKIPGVVVEEKPIVSVR